MRKLEVDMGCLPLSFIVQCLSLNLKLPVLAKEHLRSSCARSPLQQWWMDRHSLPHLIFMWVLGIQIQALGSLSYLLSSQYKREFAYHTSDEIAGSRMKLVQKWTRDLKRTTFLRGGREAGNKHRNRRLTSPGIREEQTKETHNVRPLDSL